MVDRYNIINFDFMKAPKTVLLLLMALFVLTCSEDNDFDYKNHGADWP